MILESVGFFLDLFPYQVGIGACFRHHDFLLFRVNYSILPRMSSIFYVFYLGFYYFIGLISQKLNKIFHVFRKGR